MSNRRCRIAVGSDHGGYDLKEQLAGWLKSHAGKQIAAPKAYGKGKQYPAIEPAPGRYVKAKA